MLLLVLVSWFCFLRELAIQTFFISSIPTHSYVISVRFLDPSSPVISQDLVTSSPCLSSTRCFSRTTSLLLYFRLCLLFLYSSLMIGIFFASLNLWCLVICLFYSRCPINTFECIGKWMVVIFWKVLTVWNYLFHAVTIIISSVTHLPGTRHLTLYLGHLTSLCSHLDILRMRLCGYISFCVIKICYSGLHVKWSQLCPPRKYI